MTKSYEITVQMPSGEKLETIKVDRDAFILHRADIVGQEIGRLIGKLVEQRLKA